MCILYYEVYLQFTFNPEMHQNVFVSRVSPETAIRVTHSIYKLHVNFVLSRVLSSVKEQIQKRQTWCSA